MNNFPLVPFACWKLVIPTQKVAIKAEMCAVEDNSFNKNNTLCVTTDITQRVSFTENSVLS